MVIRLVQPQDEGALAAIGRSYETAWAWQMRQRVEGEEMVIALRRVPLPRPLRAEPSQPWPPIPAGEEDTYFIVAEEGGKVVAYLRVVAERFRGVGWITHLAVAPAYRQRGTARALLEQAKRWGTINNLHALIVELPTKNDPAIRAFQRCGFTLCGYQEGLYADREVALFFSCPIA